MTFGLYRLLMIIPFLITSSVGTLGQTNDNIHKVSIGLYLADLVEVSGSNHSFMADVIMVVSWKDTTLTGLSNNTRTKNLVDIWHPELLIVNQRNVKKSLPERVTVDSDGSVQYIQRFTGTFSASMNLRSFPLDFQLLNVWVVAPVRFGKDVQLHVDKSFVRLRNNSLSINDWRLDEIELVYREFTATASSSPASGVELSIKAHRLFGYYIIQIIFPLFAIMLMAWTVFWIAPHTINVKISVVVTTMLTLIAYRFALGNHVPKLSYLTRLDWFLLGATTLVMLVLGTMAYSAYLVSTGREKKVRQIDRYGRILYPIVVIVFTLVVWLL